MSYSVYSIEEIFAEYNGGGLPDTSRAVARKALSEMGLRTTPDGGTRDRVFVTTARSTPWGVDVPSSRAEEYARKLWESEYATKVSINDTDFPKPKTVADVEKEFEAFKKKVAEVALRTKHDEGWCNDGFKAAMKELGIPLPNRKAQIVMEIEVPFDVDPDDLYSVMRHVKNQTTVLDLGDKITSTEELV